MLCRCNIRHCILCYNYLQINLFQLRLINLIERSEPLWQKDVILHQKLEALAKLFQQVNQHHERQQPLKL